MNTHINEMKRTTIDDRHIDDSYTFHLHVIVIIIIEKIYNPQCGSNQRSFIKIFATYKCKMKQVNKLYNGECGNKMGKRHQICYMLGT